jgi:hypothetical protein
LVTNSLGSFVQEQMRLLGWTRDALVERSGVDRWEIEAILESPTLPEWPSPSVMLSLARTFNVSVREVALVSAEGVGLHVAATSDPVGAMSHLSNEELMREVRRRLSLGASTGGYLTNPSSFVDSDAHRY